MSEKIEIDLDPKPVLDSCLNMSKGVKQLADDIELSLGKNAPKSIGKAEEAAEKGTNKISTYFRNLGTRVKEDLKTAFDVGKLLAGIKVADQMAQGTRQVLDMEKAFDRLNTRLGLAGKTLNEFKNNVGRKVAGTGQKLEDILPGVETVAAKGNVKDPEQLSAVAESLAKAKAITGEDTTGLADTIVEILRSEGKKVTSDSFKQTMDAVQGTRVSGAFASAGEAANAIQAITHGISPEKMAEMGLGSRQAGGLAAMASKAGAGGQDILNHILQMGTQAGGQTQLNSIFGTQLFKNGKLDASAFGKIDKKRFGEYSEQTLSAATGANQADLSRFLETMKGGMADFSNVTKGADETANQFTTATDNLATGIDKFKENMKEAGREIGESLSKTGHDLLGMKFGKVGGDLKDVGSSLLDNKGSVLAMLGLSGASALLMGSGAKGLLGKVPGLGALAGGVAGGALAKEAGVQPVYVTNASEIGGQGLGAAVAGAGGMLGKFGAFMGNAGLVTGAGAAGYGVGTLINSGIDKLTGGQGIGGELYDMLHPDEAQPESSGMPSPQEMTEAIKQGMIEGHKATKITPSYTNPSAQASTGRKM